uniref:Cleavage and polyadenylation specificity factor subunit 1 n=1 Tax=Latimeria chalumnae TaxID=7897 RepID=H2ZS88_LATCH
MYAVYRQAHPPMGLEFSIYCNFFSNVERNLVVAGSSQLYVYRLIHDAESFVKGEKNTGNPADLFSLKKKTLVISLHNTQTVLIKVNIKTKNKKKTLIATGFLETQLAVVEYDPGTHDLKTLSLHYFEEPEQRDGFVQNVHIPIVRVDPDGRCAVMLIYGTRLVVLPFRKDTLSDEHDGVMGEGQKSSFLPSYIIDIRKLDEKLLNIIDMQFLYGYYEPTLLILFEPNQTWPGRVAVRQDTCSIVAISLNIMQKVHPVIWSLTNLPFDCTQALAVPKPIVLKWGGDLVLCADVKFYCNFSCLCSPYNIKTNVLVSRIAGFSVGVQEEVKITLDCAQAAFVSYDKMVISLKGGEIYVLTLVTDGMRSVRAFHFDKAAASVLTTCMTILEPGYLFLGSRLGNSLLLKYTEKLQETPMNVGKEQEKPEEPPNKKKRVDSSAGWAGKLVSYNFCYYWILLKFIQEDFKPPPPEKKPKPKKKVLLFSCTNYLPPSQHTQNLYHPPPKKKQGHSFTQDYEIKVFIILFNISPRQVTRKSSSCLSQHGAPVTYQILVIESKSSGSYIYIFPLKDLGTLKLLALVNQLHFIPVDLGSPIVHCAMADPYVVIMSAEGQVTMFVLKSDSYGGKTHRLTLQKPQIHLQSKVISLCAFRDVSGMFTTESRSSAVREESQARSQLESELVIQDLSNTVDDEEEMLYGETSSLSSPSKEEQSRGAMPVSEKEPAHCRLEPTHWCMLARENGVMEIYQLPEWRLVFLVKNFPMGQRVLVDSSFGQQTSQGDSKKEEMTRQGEMPLVKEVLLVGLGHRQTRPYLLVHVDQELLIYEAFYHDSQMGQGNLKVRFKKVPHNINFRERKVKQSKKKSENVGGEDLISVRGKVGRFRHFEDISGYSGVFICGPSPHWLLLTNRGALRLHPMTIDGPIESFAPFHNVNCPKGFLYFNRQGELRISVLPAYLSYDTPWPVRKIPLRCTAHYVTYHVESKVYAVATSVNDICTRIPRMTGEEKEFENIERDERYIHPIQEKFSIQLISPVSWETIPNTRIDLDDWEHVTCMKTVSLKSEETVSGFKGYISVGTCMMQGEEVTCRGRILIMDVIEVVPEPGQPLTKNKFKILYEKEQKGPVTALCHCNGYLVSAIGQKIFLWSLKDNDLTGMAFIDTQLYIHQMISIKNFILAADVMKSISLLRYQEESKTLSLVSRDVKPLEVYSVEFMVDCNQLGFLVSDRDKNLLVYMYLPEAKESFGGLRLLRRADFNVGANVNTFWRTPCRGTLEGPTKKSSAWENKHITWFATLDGGVGLLLPMQEKTYRRLLMLQNALTTMIPHHAGLNPKAYRMLHVDRRYLQNAVRNILDGELLNRYLYLSTMERSELAKKIGTTPDMILDDLLEIDRVTAHF